MAAGAGPERAPDLAHARGDVIEVRRCTDRGRALVLIVFGELAPLVEHPALVGRLRDDRVALVVHEYRGVDDPFAEPAAPVLELLGVRARRLEAAHCSRSVPVRDEVRGHSDVRLERGRLEVDPAHYAGDLIPAPLRPLRVGVRQRIGASGLGAESRDGGRVVAPGRHVRPEVEVRITDPVEVDAVDVVVANDARRCVHDPGRGVGMAGVDQPVVVHLLQAVRARHHPVVPPDGRRPVQVEDMGRLAWRRRAVPHRGGDDPGVHLDAAGVRRGDERVQRVEGRRRDVDLRPRDRCPQAEAVAAPHHLGDDGVEVRGAGRGDERVDLGLIADALAERVGPERAELPADRRRGARAELRRKRGEDAREEREGGREGGEPQNSLPAAQSLVRFESSGPRRIASSSEPDEPALGRSLAWPPSSREYQA